MEIECIVGVSYDFSLFILYFHHWYQQLHTPTGVYLTRKKSFPIFTLFLSISFRSNAFPPDKEPQSMSICVRPEYYYHTSNYVCVNLLLIHIFFLELSIFSLFVCLKQQKCIKPIFVDCFKKRYFTKRKELMIWIEEKNEAEFYSLNETKQKIESNYNTPLFNAQTTNQMTKWNRFVP